MTTWSDVAPAFAQLVLGLCVVPLALVAAIRWARTAATPDDVGGPDGD